MADPALVDVSRSEIRKQLADVGFDDARQSEIVGGLSGGWKMRLELARAMLYNADLLLLDEVMSSEFLTVYRSPKCCSAAYQSCMLCSVPVAAH